MSIAIQADSNLPQGYILVNGTAAATVRQNGTIVVPTLSATNTAITNITFSDSTTMNTAPNSFGFKNRIINGDMRIDQRNAGLSAVRVNTTGGTVAESYTIDRWQMYAYRWPNVFGTNNGVLSARQVPVNDLPGFSKALSINVATAANPISATDAFHIVQSIEGQNITDLAYGTSQAKTTTLSFWVKCSITGTFAGFVRVLNNTSPGVWPYIFTYTVNNTNTWEYKTITVPGNTVQKPNNDNIAGIQILFDFGSGVNFQTSSINQWLTTNTNTITNATGTTPLIATAGANIQFTGVQLETGPTATPFELRPIGAELALCQRYYFKNTADRPYTIFGAGVGVAGNQANFYSALPVPMRSIPTITQSTLRLYSGTIGFNVTGVDETLGSKNVASVGIQVASGLTAGQMYYLQALNSTSAYIDYSAEL